MNKRILISGGSRGIGAATVKYFSERGDKVAFIYHSADEKAREIAEKEAKLQAELAGE